MCSRYYSASTCISWHLTFSTVKVSICDIFIICVHSNAHIVIKRDSFVKKKYELIHIYIFSNLLPFFVLNRFYLCYLLILLFAWTKSSKNSRLCKNACVSKQRYYRAIQGMMHFGSAGLLSLLCIATHMPFAHTSAKNRWRIFPRPVLLTQISTLGCISEQRFSSWAQFSGCGDRPYRNFITAVAEGKQRRHVCSKTQLHVLPGCYSAASSLVLRGYRGLQMYEIYIQPRLFRSFASWQKNKKLNQLRIKNR